MRHAHDVAATAVRTRYDGLAAKWPDRYIKELAALQKKYIHLADHASSAAVVSEIARFRADQVIPAGAIVREPGSLRQAQLVHLEMRLKYEIAGSRELITLADAYLSALARLEDALAKQARIEEALAVNRESDRARADEGTARARALLARATSLRDDRMSVPDFAPEPPPVPAPEPEDVPGKRTVPDPPPKETGSSFIVHRDRPPTIPGVRFKRLNMRATDAVRIPRGVSIAIYIGAQTTRDRDDEAERESSKYHVRIGLRAGSSGDAPESSTMLLDYYGRHLDGSTPARPKRIEEQLFELPPLVASAIHVDCPVVFLTRSRSRQAAGGRVRPSREKGVEFYGLIVTIFGPDERLIYQAVSIAGLAKLAPAEFPKPEKAKEGSDQPKETTP